MTHCGSQRRRSAPRSRPQLKSQLPQLKSQLPPPIFPFQSTSSPDRTRPSSATHSKCKLRLPNGITKAASAPGTPGDHRREIDIPLFTSSSDAKQPDECSRGGVQQFSDSEQGDEKSSPSKPNTSLSACKSSTSPLSSSLIQTFSAPMRMQRNGGDEDSDDDEKKTRRYHDESKFDDPTSNLGFHEHEDDDEQDEEKTPCMTALRHCANSTSYDTTSSVSYLRMIPLSRSPSISVPRVCGYTFQKATMPPPLIPHALTGKEFSNRVRCPKRVTSKEVYEYMLHATEQAWRDGSILLFGDSIVINFGFVSKDKAASKLYALADLLPSTSSSNCKRYTLRDQFFTVQQVSMVFGEHGYTFSPPLSWLDKHGACLKRMKQKVLSIVSDAGKFDECVTRSKVNKLTVHTTKGIAKAGNAEFNKRRLRLAIKNEEFTDEVKERVQEAFRYGTRIELVPIVMLPADGSDEVHFVQVISLRKPICGGGEAYYDVGLAYMLDEEEHVHLAGVHMSWSNIKRQNLLTGLPFADVDVTEGIPFYSVLDDLNIGNCDDDKNRHNSWKIRRSELKKEKRDKDKVLKKLTTRNEQQSKQIKQQSKQMQQQAKQMDRQANELREAKQMIAKLQSREQTQTAVRRKKTNIESARSRLRIQTGLAAEQRLIIHVTPSTAGNTFHTPRYTPHTYTPTTQSNTPFTCSAPVSPGFPTTLASPTGMRANAVTAAYPNTVTAAYPNAHNSLSSFPVFSSLGQTSWQFACQHPQAFTNHLLLQQANLQLQQRNHMQLHRQPQMEQQHLQNPIQVIQLHRQPQKDQQQQHHK